MSVNNIVAGAAYVKILSDNSGLEKGLSKAQQVLKKFSNGAAVAMAQLSMPFTGLSKSFFIFQEFDDRMKMVRAITGATAQQFDKLTEKAKKLGRETRFTASQVSEGMISLGRMGFSSEEIDNAVKPVMNLSTATGTELATASEIAANNMRVFGMQANEMADAADLLTVTANGSAQTLVDLGEALKMAGPLAKNAGADLKETCAALGILANMGIRGSLAGTALGKSYKRLADPKVQDYLLQFGIRTVDATGNLRNMRDILVEVEKTMRTMPSAQRITFAENIFDARGSLGGGVLSQNIAGYDEFLQKLDNASGEAARIAKEMESGIGGSFRSMMSALEGVGIAIGNSIQNPAISLMKTFTECIKSIQLWISENHILVTSFASVVAGGMAFALVGKVLSGIVILAGSACGKLKMLISIYRALTAAQVSLNLAAEGWSKMGGTIGSVSVKGLANIRRLMAGGKGLTAVFYAKALAAKAAGVAMNFLNSALGKLLINPATLFIAGIVTACTLLANHAQQATEKIQHLAEETRKASQGTGARLNLGDSLRMRNESAIQRLQELEAISRKTKLSAEQIKEAEDLLKQLDPLGNLNYGKINRELGILTLNRTKEQIETDNRFTARRDLLRDYDAKRKAYLAAAEYERTALNGARHRWNVRFWNTGSYVSDDVQKASGARLTAYQKMLEVQKRLRALDAGDRNAVYGAQKEEKQLPATSRDLIQLASQKEIDKAEKALSSARKKLAKEDQDHFDREIENIRKENAEYKKQAQFLLENEKKKLELAERRLKLSDSAENWDAVNNSRNRITDYERHISAIETTSDKAVEKVRAKRDRANAVDDIELEFRRMERIRQNGPIRNYLNQYPAHLVNLQSLMQPLIADIEELAEQYRARWTKAWEKGEFDVDEQARLKKIRIEIEQRQGQIETYRERAKQGYEAMNNYRTTTVDSAASAIRKGSVEAAQLESRMQIVNPVRQDIEKVRKAINSLGKTGKEFYHEYRENSKTTQKYTAV